MVLRKSLLTIPLFKVQKPVLMCSKHSYQTINPFSMEIGFEVLLLLMVLAVYRREACNGKEI